MAICVDLRPNGRLLPTGELPSDCSGYVLLDATEYAGVVAAGDLWTVPGTAEILAAFSSGGTLILTLYLVSRGYRAVLNMIQ